MRLCHQIPQAQKAHARTTERIRHARMSLFRALPPHRIHRDRIHLALHLPHAKVRTVRFGTEGCEGGRVYRAVGGKYGAVDK